MRKEVLGSNLTHRKRGLPIISFIFLLRMDLLFRLCDPGLKVRTFSPGFVVPVGKPGLKPVPNRDYNPFLY